jgi:hypothetical protein
MPNQLPKMVEERILRSPTPAFGPKRIAGELRRHKWGAIVVSPNGVWKVLCRHGSTPVPSDWGWWLAT